MTLHSQRLPAIFVASRRVWLVVLVTLGLCQAGLAIASIWLLQSLWDNPLLTQPLLLLLTLTVALFFLQLGQHRIAEQVAQHYLVDAREVLYSHLMSASNDRLPARLGVAMNRLITDSNSLKNWVGRGIASAIFQTCALLAYLVVCAIYWPKMLFILCLMTALSIIITLMCRIKITTLTLAIRQLRGRLSGHLCERSFAPHTVLNIAQLGKETRHVSKNSQRLGDAMVALTVPGSCLKYHSLVLSQLAFILAIFNSDGQLDKNQLLPVLLLFGLFFATLSSLNRASFDYFVFAVAKQRLNIALAKADKMPIQKTNKLTRYVPLAVKLKQLSYTGVFENLNYSATAGQRINIYGASGSGKSLLCALFNKQLSPSSGQIVLAGRRIDWLQPRRLQLCVQLISQHSQLFKGTLLSNIRYANQRIPLTTITALAAQLGINNSELMQPVNELGRHLPSGLRIRTLLIRALIKQPGLLILDDPSLLQETALLQQLLSDHELVSATIILCQQQQSTLSNIDQYWPID
ncbi:MULTISPECIES: ATP-binding cassette domain-containing protein [Pseudoalteromonas]|uniref:ATP-binding cassette domain-containing protein n=1 Tax=Pseudoalteromonas TaxID=53246 RepID=UPI000300614F|nr:MULTISPECIES: ABC transporter ATP-binding protein [Pseudoalteromonas]MCF6146735.1 hypothetical protein [Pseudoalteromonas mariniglutinosa NCIMB 1770]